MTDLDDGGGGVVDAADVEIVKRQPRLRKLNMTTMKARSQVYRME